MPPRSMSVYDWEEAERNMAYLSNVQTTTANLGSTARSRGTGSKPRQRAQEEEDEIEEVDALPGSRVGTKRGRQQAAGGDLPAAKRRAQPSEDERRLTGRYDVPSTAKTIGIPTYEGNNGVTMTGRNGRTGGHKFNPINTLHDTPHAPASAGRRIDTPRHIRTSVNGNVVQAVVAGKAASLLPTTSSIGSNVRQEPYRNFSKPNGRADGFQPEPLPKKQKMEHHGGVNGLKSDPVDLTEPEDNETLVLANVHKVVGSTAQPAPAIRSSLHPTAQALPPRPPPPEPKDNGRNNRAYENSNVYYKRGKARNRKPRDGSRGSQTSSQTPSVISLPLTNGAVARQTGTRAAPVTLDDSGGVKTQPRFATTQRRRVGQNGPMQLMRLDDGVDEYAQEKVPQGTEADHKTVSEVLRRNVDARLGVEKQHKMEIEPRQKARQRDAQLEQETEAWHAERGKGKQQANKVEQKRLSQTFVRDSPAHAPTQGLKLRERMQAESTTVPTRVSPVTTEAIDVTPSSGDELHGEVTIASRVSRSASPTNKQNGAARAGSPSNIKPTVFTNSKKLKRSQQLRKPSAQQDDEPASVRTPAIYTLACCLVGGQGRLVYDARANKFELYDGTVPALLPSGDIVSIGPKEVQKMFYDKGGSRVYLTGSATEVSNGRICIAFEDSRGVDWFLDRLLWVTKDSFEFATFSAAINARARRRSTIAFIAVVERSDDERIQYEDSEENQPPVQERARTPSPERWSFKHKPKPWSKPVEYPPQGARRVTVDFSDIERLDEGQFLNDNLISFGLRKIQEEMAPEHRESVHFFNSFFYTSLTTKNGRKSFNYDSVKKWTKGKDILGMPYVVVPINIDLHWFVAIICNLDKLKRQAVDDDEEEEKGEDEFAYLAKVGPGNAPGMDAQPGLEDPVADPSSSPDGEQPKDHTVAMKKLSIASSRPGSPAESAENTVAAASDVFEFDEHGNVAHSPAPADNSRQPSDQPDSRPSTATGKNRKGGKKKFTPSARKYDPDTPAVITLDSFGLAHTGEVRNLKEYVILEAADKRGMAVTKEELFGVSAKGIPQQGNFCDCGVYLLAYVEQFAKDPGLFVRKVLSKAIEEESDFASFVPSEKRAEIRGLLMGLNDVQEAARREMKRAKAGEKGLGGKVPGSAAATAAAAEAPAAKAEKQPAGKAVESAAQINVPAAAAAAVGGKSVAQRPSDEPPASSYAVHGRKAPKPSQKAEIATSTVPRTASNADEEDELDSGPARPLTLAAVSGPAAPAAAHASHNAEPNNNESDGEEMLDGNVDQDADSPSVLEAGPVVEGQDLLAPLEGALAQESRTVAQAGTSVPSPLGNDIEQSSPEAEAEEDLEEQRSQQPVEQSSRLAEVADSQEKVRVMAVAPRMTGTHIKFDD
ncbi:hypothetical protein B0A55_02358 [Friedmanniomyces simplex]|uniref:Ubiquitin-like protease family profile domain-containing protein n=1 Tax=Friedmanniomyces simplex TaxID=329884 RepID=A0A4U0XTZ2_9PEZI|nr:hypothetical protein B0A55_02358 [Friedmanniomyces simplex]